MKLSDTRLAQRAGKKAIKTSLRFSLSTIPSPPRNHYRRRQFLWQWFKRGALHNNEDKDEQLTFIRTFSSSSLCFHFDWAYGSLSACLGALNSLSICRGSAHSFKAWGISSFCLLDEHCTLALSAFRSFEKEFPRIKSDFNLSISLISEQLIVWILKGCGKVFDWSEQLKF